MAERVKLEFRDVAPRCSSLARGKHRRRNRFINYSQASSDAKTKITPTSPRGLKETVGDEQDYISGLHFERYGDGMAEPERRTVQSRAHCCCYRTIQRSRAEI